MSAWIRVERHVEQYNAIISLHGRVKELARQQHSPGNRSRATLLAAGSIVTT
jgi:hypothetical protein